jgi:hypothetical protein
VADGSKAGDAGVLVGVVRVVGGGASSLARDAGAGAVAHGVVGVAVLLVVAIVGTGDLVGGVVAVSAGWSAAIGKGFVRSPACGVESVSVAADGSAVFEVGVGEELAGGVVGFALGDAVFVDNCGAASSFVVGIVRDGWRSVGGDALELGTGGPCIFNGAGARIDQIRAQTVGIVVIADDAGRAAGKGLRFRGQEVAVVVGIVAF